MSLRENFVSQSHISKMADLGFKPAVQYLRLSDICFSGLVEMGEERKLFTVAQACILMSLVLEA